MSPNKPIIHKKIPYLDGFNSIEDAFNYMVKTLNSSFQDPKVVTTVTENQDQAISKFMDYSIQVTGNTSFSFPHGLGQTPTGWMIIDQFPSSPSALAILQRNSWDAANINLASRALIAGDVTFKIRVFV